MIEPIMFFSIGFFVASLLGLALIPLVHNRAVRLTMRRLEAATPLSMAEIQADKDQLRAEFAMSTRRLELSVEQMKAKTTSQLAELGKKNDAINRLKIELGEKTAAIFALEAREKALRDQLHATEGEHSVKIGALREAERSLSDKQAELSKLATDLSERSTVADSQRVEAVALRAQTEALRERVTAYEREAQELADRLERERKDALAASEDLRDERAKADKLGDRVAELERALVAQTTEAEILARRLQEMETRQTEQMQVITQREFENNQLREIIIASQKTEADLRGALETAAVGGRSAVDHMAAEKSVVENRLAVAIAEQERLQNEIANMKREAEQSWASERVENAMLRERINDIAVEIARLTVALEGKTSPIEAMLAGLPTEESVPLNGDEPPPVAGQGKGNLADRIRALQTKASRVSTPN
jgi:chromosome segregation ATPase